MRIKDIGEGRLIKEIISGQKQKLKDDIIIGIGDDAAVVRNPSDCFTLMTCHMAVENSHFLLAWSTPFQIGYKAVTRSVADIEAMGGISNHLLVGLALPPETDIEFIIGLYQGINTACGKCGITVIGGDISSCPGPIVISMTLNGKVKSEHLTRKDGANPGDLIVVTGHLGAAAAGLHLLKEGIWANSDSARTVIRKQVQPEPPVAKGSSLAQTGAVTAMNDISDSLIANLNNICRSGRVGAIIRLSDLPLSEAASEIARDLNYDPVKWALYGGEDYELVAAVDQVRFNDVNQVLRSSGKELYEIGKITEEQGIWGQDNKGNRFPIEPKGHDHFQG
ncbi:MAG: thiamine-phosphate kinase [Chitinophagales bacterium]